MAVTVIILTFNEEANLPAALDSVCGWASEIYVVDSYSTDRTVDIAIERAGEGVRVVQHEFENYSQQWNWAISHLPIHGEWTLKLDADERCTAEFKSEVDERLRDASANLEGMFFRRRLIFMGTPIHGSGSSDAYVLHLWRTGRATFEDRAVNEHAIVEGEVSYLHGFVEHRNTKSLSDWLDKHNRYTSLEALSLIQGNIVGGVTPRLFGRADERRIWLRSLYYRVPYRLGVALVYFLYRYVWKLGFLDGVAGFHLCFLQVAFRYITDLKVCEYRKTGTLPEVRWPARGEAHPTVAASELQRLVDQRGLPEMNKEQERAWKRCA